MPFDPKNKADKAKLYPVLRAIADLDTNTSPESLMDEAIGTPIARGHDYARNMRKSEIRTSYAALTHQWVMDHHLGLAHRLAPDIFDQNPEQQWQAIIDERATVGQLSLVTGSKSLGIARRAREKRPAAQTIRFEEEFCLQLDCADDGDAIAFQQVHGEWYNLPLGSDGQASAPIKQGINLLPQNDHGKADPLIEEEHQGTHEFVLISFTDGTPPTTLSGLISWVRDHPCIIHHTEAYFAK